MRSAALLGLLILAGSTPAVAQRAPWDPGPALVEGAYCRRPQRAPNTDFVAIAAGGAHSLGLEADGSIVAWGLNTFGQCNVPAPNTGFVVLAGAAGLVAVRRKAAASREPGAGSG